MRSCPRLMEIHLSFDHEEFLSIENDSEKIKLMPRGIVLHIADKHLI